MVARFEETYLVFSGREGGTSDESRGFFVPYDEISYIRIERPVRVAELKRMYGETGFQDMEDRLAAQTAAHSAQKGDGSVMPVTPSPVPTPSPMASDPAAIARQNLLDRIRAARANVELLASRADLLDLRRELEVERFLPVRIDLGRVAPL